MGFGSSSAVARAVGIIEADIGPWKKGLREAEGEMKNTTSRMSTMGKAAGVAGAAGLGLLAIGAKGAVDAYTDAEKAQGRMTAQLKASGISYEKYAGQIDATIKKQSELSAFDDEDLQDSFTNLVRTTGDVTEALKLNGTAADIARAKGMSLESASKLLQKAYMGSAGAAKKLGIEIQPVTTAQDKLEASTKKATDAQKDAAKKADETATQQKILAELQGTFAGQAEAYGESNAGAAERMQNSMENLQESMGRLLAPMVEKISRLFGDLAQWAEKNQGIMKVLIGVFAAVSASLVAFSIITKIVEMFKALAIVTRLVTAAQWLLNVALDANPIGIVVVAIAALIAGLILAYKHSETFRKAVDGMVAVMKPAWEWIKEHWKLLASIIAGPVVAIILFRDKIRDALNAVKNFFASFYQNVKDKLGQAASWVRDKASNIVEFIKGIPGKIGEIGSKIWNKLKGGWNDIKTFVKNAAQAVVNFITDIPGKIGDIGAQIGQKILGGLRSVWNGIAAIINKGIDAFNFLPGPDIGHVPSMQHGGYIAPILPGTAYGVDGVPAMIAPGEAVLTNVQQANAAHASGLSVDEWRRMVGIQKREAGGGYQTGGYYYPLASRGSIIGTPGSGTHSRSERGYIWQDDDAWDLGVPIGTPIVAYTSGSWAPRSYGGPPSSRFGGWGAYFSGGGGQAYYKHMTSVKPAGHYQGGEVLGMSGAGASVPHLHIGFSPLSLGYKVIGGALGGKPLFDEGKHEKYKVKHHRYESELKQGKVFKWGGYYWGKAIGNGEKDFTDWWKSKNNGKTTGLSEWKKKYEGAAYLLTHSTPKKDKKKGGKKGGTQAGGGGGGTSSIPEDTTPEMNEQTQTQVDEFISEGGYVAGINAPTYAEWKVMKEGAKKDKDKRTEEEKRLFEKYSEWRGAMKDKGVEWWKQQYPTLGIATVAPIGDQPGPAPEPPTTDGGTDPETGGGGGDAGGGDSGPTAAEIEAQIQERLRAEASAVWSARQGFYTDLGSNIFTPGPQGMTMGSTAGAAGVTVVQNFNRPPEDQFANLKRAERAASAAFGK